MPEDETPGMTARRLIRSADRAALATKLADDGGPYVSLVMVACGHDAAPLLLLSDLAEHTKNLGEDSRAALLFDGTAGFENPLTGPRVTVLGRLAACDDEALMARYAARHPEARAYRRFADFRLFRMEVERAHIVAGFGMIRWLGREDIRLDTAAAGALADAEAEIVAHMNAAHSEALDLYAGRLLGLGGRGWTMTGVDPEGADLRRGGAIARLAFETQVTGPEEARAELVRLAAQGRAAADGRTAP